MRIHLASQLFTPRPQGVFCRDLAAHWAARGHEVVVFTADHDVARPGGAFRLVGNLPVVYGRSSLPIRLASRLAFGAAAALASARDARTQGTPDIFVSAGVLPAVWPSMGRRVHFGQHDRTPFVVWLFDLWPDVLQAHNPGSRLFRGLGPPLSFVLGRVLEAADAVVTISPAMGKIIGNRVRSAHVRTIPLWASEEDGARGAALAQQQADAGDGSRVPLVAAYHGNLGLSYDFEPILEAAKCFSREEVRFLIVGDGTRRHEIARRIADHRLDNVELRSSLSASAFWRSLTAADVCLLPLRDTWDVVSFPSKLLAYLASGRPILVSGAQGGETARLVNDNHCGLTVPATATGVVSGLRTMLRERAERARMGEAGRRLYETRFSAARAFHLWDELLISVDAQRKR